MRPRQLVAMLAMIGVLLHAVFNAVALIAAVTLGGDG